MDVAAAFAELVQSTPAPNLDHHAGNPLPVGTLAHSLWSAQQRRRRAETFGRQAARDQAVGQYVLNPYVENTPEHFGWAVGFDAETRVLLGELS